MVVDTVNIRQASGRHSYTKYFFRSAGGTRNRLLGQNRDVCLRGCNVVMISASAFTKADTDGWERPQNLSPQPPAQRTYSFRCPSLRNWRNSASSIVPPLSLSTFSNKSTSRMRFTDMNRSNSRIRVTTLGVRAKRKDNGVISASREDGGEGAEQQGKKGEEKPIHGWSPARPPCICPCPIAFHLQYQSSICVDVIPQLERVMTHHDPTEH